MFPMVCRLIRELLDSVDAVSSFSDDFFSYRCLGCARIAYTSRRSHRSSTVCIRRLRHRRLLIECSTAEYVEREATTPFVFYRNLFPWLLGDDMPRAGLHQTWLYEIEICKRAPLQLSFISRRHEVLQNHVELQQLLITELLTACRP